MKNTLLAASLLALLQAAAHGGQVQISVTTPDGQPAADVAVMVHPTAAWTAQPLPEPVVIAQRNIRFVPFVTVVPVGATVRFVNQDRFDHHVRSQPGGPLGNVAPARQFEFRMAAAGKDPTPADLKMDVPGTVALGCHLHGSMRGHVVVSTTPWFAVTDDKGVATIAGVPDGQVELKLWHPEQLSDQAAIRLQVAGSASADARLNFAPRRRGAAAPPPRY
ncbi:cupredoxin domain-containing protein [Aquabacterium humicola]|uniref:cupredoxin domain-containing protein n=1 Tax=Aquabacterium humicola TaxID=3237377 RepID=UPI002543EC29|nr:plastocyanin [Rubrivivax pictus]